MTDRELMQQALEALELLARYENPATKIQVRKPKDGGPIVTMYPHKVATDAAVPLRERPAQPEQEPVAFRNKETGEFCTGGFMQKEWSRWTMTRQNRGNHFTQHYQRLQSRLRGWFIRSMANLYMRLKPVMADAPMHTASNQLCPVVSPLGLSIYQYRQQTSAVIDDLAHIIESLEI